MAKRKHKKREPRPRKKSAPRKPAPRKKSPRRPAPKTRDWRSSPTTRKEIVGALAKIAGSLASSLIRAPLNSSETVYLRGIANLKLGKRPTPAQALALLAAKRAGSPLARAIFGKRENALVTAFVERMTGLAFRKTRTPTDILKHFSHLPPGIALQLAQAHSTGKSIFYREKAGGATQNWSIDGFRRFISNPIYKLRRTKVFKGGNFWMAHADTGTRGEKLLPKKGRTKLIVQ